MRIGFLECFSGISGDMLLGALVDAGVSFEALEEAVAALKVGARLKRSKVTRGGLSATKVDVLVDEAEHSHDHSHVHDGEVHTHAPHRHLSTILRIIAEAELPDAVKTSASRAFQLLGEAEASIHAIPVEQVHFHEVGAVDTIIDIVCSAVGAERLGVDRWIASPLNVGSGTVKCAHGTLPVPAPATLALLGDAPVYAAGTPMERVTPTGATVLRMLNVSYDVLPVVRVVASGYGAGGRDLPGEPNLLRLIVGETQEKIAVPHDGDTEPIAVMTAVIDDANPQVLAYASEQLLAAGAWDVYRAAVQMKKSRAGVEMTVLCRPDLVPALEEILFRETTTIGLRWRIETKRALKREFVTVATPWGVVRIKVARLVSGEVTNAQPEFEDCRELAEENGVPLKQVMQTAVAAYAQQAKENA
jgi:uncharacterized protein (TIGR00299 family) protein